MGIKPKGPLFLLRETEALLCAHSQSVQQASFVWKRLPLCGKGVLCVENCIANNQRIIRRNLNKCFYQSNWIWCIHDFNHQLRIFKLKTFCFLKILLVIKYRQMYTALPVPSEKSTSHICPITKLLLFKCHATFILPKWLRGNSELFSHIPLNVTFLSLRKI